MGQNEARYRIEHGSRRQMGITFPPALEQENILIARIDLDPSAIGEMAKVKQGLEKLCGLFEKIATGSINIDIFNSEKRLEQVKLSKFNFSATLGFGIGFFDKLGINGSKRPRKLCGMPDHIALGDSLPYVLPQTDMIIQLCSSHEYVNKWILTNNDYDIEIESRIMDRPNLTPRSTRKAIEDREASDIVRELEGWAVITDIHSGFQRHDGRNLMGFPDGISQPFGKSRDTVVWTTKEDEIPELIDGTYLVFQKIEHDLASWQKLSVENQEKWVGRSKATGLLLGTLSREDDRRLAKDCKSSNIFVRKSAEERLKKLLDPQRDPEKRFFSGTDFLSRRILRDCPANSHVRLTNPRGEGNAPLKFIYRRGYLYTEDNVHNNGRLKSGLLFICFQRDVHDGFEYIKKQSLKSALRYMAESAIDEKYRKDNPRSFPKGPYSTKILSKRDIIGPQPDSNSLSIFSPVTLGGGYYFVPPIPNNKVSDLGQLFFA